MKLEILREPQENIESQNILTYGLTEDASTKARSGAILNQMTDIDQTVEVG